MVTSGFEEREQVGIHLISMGVALPPGAILAGIARPRRDADTYPHAILFTISELSNTSEKYGASWTSDSLVSARWDRASPRISSRQGTRFVFGIARAQAWMRWRESVRHRSRPRVRHSAAMPSSRCSRMTPRCARSSIRCSTARRKNSCTSTWPRSLAPGGSTPLVRPRADSGAVPSGAGRWG